MNTISYPSAEATAQKLAERIQQEVEKSEIYYLALTGEVTAIPLYQALAQASIDWNKVQVYYASEIVSGAKKGFHHTLAQAHLWDKVNIPTSHIHPIRTEVAADAEARRYAQEIMDTLPKVSGVPRFDLVLMDMTSDGHVAGIFSGQHELFLEESLTLTNNHPSSGDEYISLSIPTIESAKSLALYAFGGEARFAIGDIINLLPEAKAYPANFIASRCPWIYLYADAESMREKSYSIY